MAAAGPRDIVGTADVDEELALDAEFKKKGLTALVFFGIDPGASDVFARALYDQFDTVERLTVLDGDNASAEGYDFAPSFSPTTMVEECLILPPHAFENGKIIRRKSLSKSGEFEFPAPVGKLKVWNVDHEESQLMPMFLADKGLRKADFFIALDDGWVNLLLAWRKLGFDHNKEIEFERLPGSGRSTCSSRACPSPSTSSASCTARSAWARSPRAPSAASACAATCTRSPRTTRRSASAACRAPASRPACRRPAPRIMLAKGIVTEPRACSRPSRSTRSRSSS